MKKKWDFSDYYFRIGPVLIGIAFICGGVYYKLYLIQQRNWPQAQGYVVFSDVYQPDSDDYIRIQVNYKYTVNGTTFSRFDYSNETYFTYESARERMLGQGTYVTVYYNPGNPSESVIYFPTHRSAHMAIAAGVGSILFGAVVMFASSRKSPSGSDNSEV